MPVYERPAFYYIIGMTKRNEMNKIMKIVDQTTKHSAPHTETTATKRPTREPDLFNPGMSWDELREQWDKAQRGI